MDTTFEETQQAAGKVLRQTKDKVGEFGRTMQTKIDDSRVPAADTLENAASALHQRADRFPGGPNVAGAVHGAADKMQATADYVRDHEVRDMMADVETLVRRNPGPSLAVAAAIGFLVGRAFRSNNRS